MNTATLTMPQAAAWAMKKKLHSNAVVIDGFIYEATMDGEGCQGCDLAIYCMKVAQAKPCALFWKQGRFNYIGRVDAKPASRSPERKEQGL